MLVKSTTISEDMQLLGIKSLAAAFGCHPKTLATRVKEADIRVYRVSKYNPSIKACDVPRLLAACEEAQA